MTSRKRILIFVGKSKRSLTENNVTENKEFGTREMLDCEQSRDLLWLLPGGSCRSIERC